MSVNTPNDAMDKRVELSKLMVERTDKMRKLSLMQGDIRVLEYEIELLTYKIDIKAKAVSDTVKYGSLQEETNK